MEDNNFFMYIIYCLAATFTVLDKSHLLNMIGIFLASVLLGMLLAQTHTYLFGTDRRL